MTAKLLASATLLISAATHGACPDFLNQDYRKLHSTESINLCEAFEGKNLLIVNTASHCGFTPQFKALEAVYQQYKDQNFAVIGFASDDFKQEDAKEAKAAEICYINYGVTFTMLAPTAVTGADANPTFKALAAATEAPGWNFNKYVVSADGKQISYFGSRVKPDDVKLTRAIDALAAP
ncbi:glutathione peroxidase [Simiduia curdlanivorans]|uniref:Glutathione peroxidase n=1 Tax=Simiduia curdlanivorans TaxID=1492769 RepID=A0ABV8V220_9GAMM|nr:glutathione peroxidase [Simiduia curdlanivorans]MDN3640133.1 glutathione peroxidase [Simiduia curdlanivorans]